MVCNQHMLSGDFYSLDHWFNLLWYTLVKTIKSAAISNYELLANVTHKQNIDYLEMSHKTLHQQTIEPVKCGEVALTCDVLCTTNQHCISIFQ